MKLTTRILSLLLAALLLATTGAFAGCSTADESAETTPAAPTEAASEAAETDANDRAGAKDNLPDDLDFGGETLVLLTRTGDEPTRQEFIATKEDTDVLSEAVYERNTMVETRLNLKLEILEEKVSRHSNGTISDKIAKTVQAGTDDYQLVGAHMHYASTSVLAGHLADLAEATYIDRDMPWWNASYTKEITVMGHQFLAMGELGLTYISGMFGVFFNKDLWEETRAPDELYDMVMAGDWTLDAFIACTKDYNRDLNGDSVIDENDVVGLYGQAVSLHTDALLAGASVIFTEEVGEDEYEVVLSGDRTFAVADKIRVLLFENNGAYLNHNLPVFEEALDQLSENKALFNINMLGTSSRLREMEGDYGVLPMPKFDTLQETYTSFTHDGSTVFGVPTTVKNFDMVTAFMEAMAAESYRRVTPAYYDIVLKLQTARDPRFSEMLDLIVKGIYFDFSYVYGQTTGSLVGTLRGVFDTPQNLSRLASTIRGSSKSCLAGIRNVIRSIERLDQH